MSPAIWPAPRPAASEGGLGLAEDPSHASLSCHQIGPHHPARQAEGGEEVFDVSTSLVFKEQKVVRFTTRSAMPLSI